ncbi:hypothetical protein ACO0R3_002816 [Hanseniaspora guilliermondii]
MADKKLSLGECIYISIKPIIRVYLILGTGYLLSKKGLLTPQMTKDISTLVVNALLPCLAFNKIVNYISYKDIKMIGIIVLTSLIIYSLGLLGGVLVYFGFKTEPRFFYGLLFCSSCTNISDLTISIMQSEGLQAIFTTEQLGKGVSYAVIFMSVQNFCLMNLGLMTIPYYDVREDLKKDEEDNKSMHDTITNASGNTMDGDGSCASDELDSEEIEEAEIAHHQENFKQRRQRRASLQSVLTRPFTNTGGDGTTELVREYSIVSKVKTGDFDVSKPMDLYAEHPSENIDQKAAEMVPELNLKRQTFSEWCYKNKLGWLYYVLINFKRPCSVATVLGLLCALVPWLRILFVKQKGYHIHQGPDNAPVLSVFMDFTLYVSQASVPIALLLLGGTIAKIDLGKLDYKFLKAAVVLNVYRLCVMPIIGIAFVNRLVAIGWLDKGDAIQRLSLVMTFAVPSATACLYFTAMFTPVTGPQVQMACLGSVYVVAYLMFFVTLAVVLTYTIKHDLGY